MTFLNILQQRWRSKYVNSLNTLKRGDAADYEGASMRVTKQLCRKDNFLEQSVVVSCWDDYSEATESCRMV